MATMTDADLLALYERTVDELYRHASRLRAATRRWLAHRVVPASLPRPAEARRTRPGARAARHRPSAHRGRWWARSRCVGTEVPADQRAVLVLRYVDEMTVSEVAHTMGRSVHATESLLARARTTLRSILTQGVK